MTRHADVLALFADPRVSSAPRYAGAEARSWPQVAAGLAGPLYRSVLMVDEPDHGRLRRLIGREFSPRRLQALRPTIEGICADLLAAIGPRGSADLIADFAAVLPLAVICDLLGVPVADRELFRRWVLIIGGIDEDSVSEQPRAFAEVTAYLTELIETKSGQRDGFAEADVLGAMIAVRGDGDNRLSGQELFGTAALILLAGGSTAMNLIANGMLALLRHPDQLAALRADPSLVDGAVEEFLRYDTPVSYPGLRYTREEVPVAGVVVPPNEVLILALHAANRDPAVFADPDTLDIRRADNPHVGMGHGVHYCLGAALARLQAQVAFPALLAGLPDLALAAEPTWRVGMPTRGMQALQVTFTPAPEPTPGAGAVKGP